VVSVTQQELADAVGTVREVVVRVVRELRQEGVRAHGAGSDRPDRRGPLDG
jgi:CRP-like cAMP-binding protein